MTNSDTIKWHQKIFLNTLYLTWLLYPLSLFIEKQYDLQNVLHFVDLAVKLYVSIVLIYKFNPWFGNKDFTKFDRKLAWHAGFFLFVSTLSVTIVDIVQGIFFPIKKHILT